MAGVLRQGFFGPGEARATSISRSGSVRSEQRSPGAKRTAALWVAPSLACGFVARRSQPHCGGCSLLAPRHRPNWAQQNTSHLGDTTLEVHGPIARSHDWASKTIKLFLHRPDVATGDNHVVEPDGLAVFPVLLGRVALVVAVVFEPEAIHLQIHVVAPTDAGEFTDQPPIHPHGLLAVGFVRRGVRPNLEL